MALNVVDFNRRSCGTYQRFFDAYLDNELLIETTHDILQHLNVCRVCTQLIEERSNVKQLVKTAVSAEAIPEAMERKLRARLLSSLPFR